MAEKDLLSIKTCDKERVKIFSRESPAIVKYLVGNYFAGLFKCNSGKHLFSLFFLPKHY